MLVIKQQFDTTGQQDILLHKVTQSTTGKQNCNGVCYLFSSSATFLIICQGMTTLKFSIAALIWSFKVLILDRYKCLFHLCNFSEFASRANCFHLISSNAEIKVREFYKYSPSNSHQVVFVGFELHLMMYAAFRAHWLSYGQLLGQVLSNENINRLLAQAPTLWQLKETFCTHDTHELMVNGQVMEFRVYRFICPVHA